ncbi:hypothetical protein [Anditalea andensis]|uniref:Uncharacterized protein n=1 Tax=Anditalea andensis TaxID=1048983 RepID=A0A074KZL5_9BACT|nr:hypothetical protein [Anditalea andensis]KEO74374.1 hypothetical protein EL17_06455 [Anditalea andensis]
MALNEDGNFIQFRTSGSAFVENDLIYANDEYAYENPTVVFGSFNDDEMIVDPGDPWYGGRRGNPSPQPSVHYPYDLGLNCTNVSNTDIINWSMKNFKITGNTRGWPHPNRISMWVLGTNPTSAPFFDREKISRGDFDWKNDFIPYGGVIATGW